MTGIEMAQAISDTLFDRYGDSLDPTLIYKQLAHESGNFNSELATKYHNYSGLTQTEPNDLKQPDGENYYRSFASDEEYADAMANYLHLYKEDGLFNATNSRQYAEALKRGGYFTDTVDHYADSMEGIKVDNLANGMEKFNGRDTDYADLAQYSSLVSPTEPIVPQVTEEVPEQSLSLAGDKFLDALYDTIVVGGARTAYVKSKYDAVADFKLSQKEIDDVFKELDNDYTATMFVCQNANSYAQLKALIDMKKEDLERRKRIDASAIGLTTIGTIAGSLLDPLNYITLLGTAGKAYTVSKYLKLGAYGAAYNLFDRAIAEKTAGFKQDYVSAFAIGMIAGGGLPLARDLIRKGYTKAGTVLLKKVMDAEDDAVKIANGAGTGTRQFMNADDFLSGLKKFHDFDYAKGFKNTELADMINPNNKVFVVSFEEAKKLAEERGITLKDNAKAFFDDVSGASVLIKDKLKGEQDVLRTLLHEKGVHGLKSILPPDEYKKILDSLQYALENNPSPAMLRASQRSAAEGKGTLEETLGYLMEEVKPSNPLYRKLKKMVDKSLGGKRMSDEDFVDLVKNKMKENANTGKGYRVLDEDGACEMNDFHYSKDNILNPEALNYVGDISWGKSISRFLNRSKLFATPYTYLSSSVSPFARQFAKRFLLNPYMTDLTNGIPVEQYKLFYSRRAMTWLFDFYKVRDEYLKEQGKVLSFANAQAKQDFNKMAVLLFDSRYAGMDAKRLLEMSGIKADPTLLKAVEKLDALRDNMITDMKNTQRTMGEGVQYLPDDWEANDKAFFRFVDDDKFANFVLSFGEKQAYEFLEKYFTKAMKRDVIRKMLEKEAKEAWKKETEELAKQGRKAPTKAPDAPVKRPASITDEQVEARVKEEAKKAALGYIDRDANGVFRSNLKETSNRTLQQGTTQLNFMKHRVPIDTSVVMKDHLGRDFSFDNNLRSYDIDNILPQMLNRWAGELAMCSVVSRKGVNYKTTNLGMNVRIQDTIANQRKVLEAQLKNAKNNKLISESEMQEDLDAFDYVVNRILGTATKDTPKTRWDLAAALLKDMSYAQNGANMGINQIGEVSGVIAYEGLAPIFDFIPSLGKSISDAKYGKEANKLMDDAVYDMYGDNTTRYIFTSATSTSSVDWRKLGTIKSRGFDATMDAIHGGVRTAASFTSTISGLQKLTASMIDATRKHCIIDINKMLNSVKDAGDNNFSVDLSQFGLTKPFSDKKLKAAGFKDLNDFISTYRPFMKQTKDGSMNVLDVKALEKESPRDFFRLYQFVDNQSRRCITQETIGNANLLKESSAFWRIFFQFKDFTMRATHSQSLRVLSNRELDDYLSTIFGVATAIPCYAGLAYARAWAKYHDDDTKRKKYLDKYLSPSKVLYAGLMRSPILGSPLSSVNDMLEMAGVSPAPTIRTTVNRYENPNFLENPSGAIGSAVAQLPAINTGVKMAKVPYDVANAMLTNDVYTEQDLQNFLSTLPSQNHILSIYLREELADWLNLPKKNRKKKRR